MNLLPGKSYYTRSGEVVRIIHVDFDNPFYKIVAIMPSGKSNLYARDGRHLAGEEHCLDIIGEVDDDDLDEDDGDFNDGLDDDEDDTVYSLAPAGVVIAACDKLDIVINAEDAKEILLELERHAEFVPGDGMPCIVFENDAICFGRVTSAEKNGEKSFLNGISSSVAVLENFLAEKETS